MYKGISLDQAPPEDIPLRFFLTAPVFGILAGLLIAYEGNSIFISNWTQEAIALTHLFTLGWLAMIMIGAFYQMVPVLVGGTVPYMFISRTVHSTLSAGILLFVSGVYLSSETTIVIATLFMVPAFTIFILQIVIALFKVTADRPTVVAMRISIISLAVVVILGIIFSGAHASLWDFNSSRMTMTSIHVILGLFGWVGSLIMGVGFHVIPMFYITPLFPAKSAKIVLFNHLASLILVPVALFFNMTTFWIFLSMSPGFVGSVLFIFTMHRMLKQRKRKIVDSVIRFWQTGLLLLLMSLVSVLLILFFDSSLFIFLFGLFFIVGYGLAITSGMLYKIVPFLVWFHRFSLLIGKIDVPLMKDISPDRTARKQWKFFIAALIIMAVGVILDVGFIVRIGGIALTASSGLLLVNLINMVKMKAPEVPEDDDSNVFLTP